MAGLKVRTSGLSHRKSREDCASSAMRSLGCELASLNGEGYLGQACVRAGGTCRLVWVWHQEFGGTVKVWVGSFIRLVNAYCRMGFKGQMIDPENLGFQKEGGFRYLHAFLHTHRQAATSHHQDGVKTNHSTPLNHV